MAEDRSTFGNENIVPQQFETLLKKPKKGKPIDINGEFDFSSDVLTKRSTDLKPTVAPETTTSSSKRGRPITIKDHRYKVNRPKMISSALENKLSILQDYVEEFQDITGRITFEKYIDTLTEFYIKQKLGIAKEEHLRFEIKQAFDNLEKK